MIPLLLKMGGGLGDLVQLSVVIQHLWKKYPERQIYVSAPSVWQDLLYGVADAQFALGFEPKGEFEVRAVHGLEPCRSYFEHPSTKAERWIRETLTMMPQVPLCNYILRPSKHAFVEARTIHKGRKYGLVHYQGHSYRDKKDLPESIAGDVCEVMREFGITPLVIDFGRQSKLKEELLQTYLHPLVLTALAEDSSFNVGIDSGPGHIFQAVAPQAILTWSGFHPIHYACPAKNTLHHIPEDHERLIKDGPGIHFFEKHYRYSAAPRACLPDLVRRQLQGANQCSKVAL